MEGREEESKVGSAQSNACLRRDGVQWDAKDSTGTYHESDVSSGFVGK